MAVFKWEVPSRKSLEFLFFIYFATNKRLILHHVLTKDQAFLDTLVIFFGRIKNYENINYDRLLWFNTKINYYYYQIISRIIENLWTYRFMNLYTNTCKYFFWSRVDNRRVKYNSKKWNISYICIDSIPRSLVQGLEIIM